MVALLAEGVDRNIANETLSIIENASPSSRRAWIEIYVKKTNPRTDLVALLTEGVDRNALLDEDSDLVERRPPRGGRG